MIQLLPLCSIPKLATRDGWAGATAHFPLPFSVEGLWFASGQIYDFADTIAQDTYPVIAGRWQPDTFKKDCCTCSPNI